MPTNTISTNSKNKSPAQHKASRPRRARPVANRIMTRKTMRTGIPKLISSGSSVIVSNREIAISVTGTATTGVIPAGGAICIMQFMTGINAKYLDISRWISKIAGAYDKWILKSLTLHFVPALPFTAAGMYSLFFDADPTRSAAPTGVLATSGDMGAVSKQIYSEATYNAKHEQLNRLPQYETYPGGTVNVADALIGSINLSWDAITLASAATGTVSIGNVWMEYTVQFLNPSGTMA